MGRAAGLERSLDSRDASSSVEGKKRKAQAFWERYFEFYDTLNQAIPYRRMIERQVELLSPLSGERILDAGTGTGNVAVELLARGSRVTGVDFCEPALVRCRRKAPAGDFRFGDLTQRLDLPDGGFDKAACCCVLHVLDHAGQEQAVREIFRVVRPGGLAVVTAFATGFDPIQVYLETLREQRRVSSLPGMIAFGVRYSFDTARILYYVSRIKRLEKSGEYLFFDRERLLDVLRQAGFEVLSDERVFASQCVTAVARRPLETRA
ncbi:MAG: methyltransferase domain-containing protein [Acidobacteriota bacterium]